MQMPHGHQSCTRADGPEANLGARLGHLGSKAYAYPSYGRRMWNKACVSSPQRGAHVKFRCREDSMRPKFRRPKRSSRSSDCKVDDGPIGEGTLENQMEHDTKTCGQTMLGSQDLSCPRFYQVVLNYAKSHRGLFMIR